MRLMLKVTTSTVAWSVGAWKLTRRDMAGLNGMQLGEYKKCIRLPRFWGESKDHFQRRLASLSKCIRTKLGLVDLDGYMLGRMYDYVGDVVRAGHREQQHLPSLALFHRDREFCLQHEQSFNHQAIQAECTHGRSNVRM